MIFIGLSQLLSNSDWSPWSHSVQNPVQFPRRKQFALAVPVLCGIHPRYATGIAELIGAQTGHVNATVSSLHARTALLTYPAPNQSDAVSKCWIQCHFSTSQSLLQKFIVLSGLFGLQRFPDPFEGKFAFAATYGNQSAISQAAKAKLSEADAAVPMSTRPLSIVALIFKAHGALLRRCRLTRGGRHA